MAWAFAQYLFCTNKNNDDSCGECSSCLKSQKLTHPDLHWIFPVVSGKGSLPVSDHFIYDWRLALLDNPYLSEEDWYMRLGASNKQGFIGVQEATELHKKTALKAYEGGYKIIIIWHAEKMHNPTSNKLLKLLEEPPEKTIFIVLTPSSEDLLDTIVSRLQHTQIDGCDETALKHFLKSTFNIESETALQVSRLSGGNIGHTIQLIQGSDWLNANTQEFQQWMRLCYQAKIIEMSEWVSQISQWGREQQKSFLQYALHMIRESLIQNFGDSKLQKIREEESLFTQNFSPFIHQNNALQIIEEIELAHQHIARNGSSKIVFMDLSLSMVVLLRVKSITLQTRSN